MTRVFIQRGGVERSSVEPERSERGGLAYSEAVIAAGNRAGGAVGARQPVGRRRRPPKALIGDKACDRGAIRALAGRHDKLADSLLGMLHLGATNIRLNFVHGT